MYSFKMIIRNMFNNVKVNISSEIYDTYDSEITAEFIILHKILLNFIVQIYGVYNLLFIVIGLVFYDRIGLDSYIGIFEIIFALFFLYSFNHWNEFYKKHINFFIGLIIFQFIIFTYIQYSYSENIVGFLPLIFSITISAITIIKYNKIYNWILFTILSLDIIASKFIYNESLIKLTILTVENVFIYYCAIFINAYFTKMKITEIINKKNLILQRDTDGLTGLINRNAAEKYINECLINNVFGVIMVLDIDNFKQVNDNFGHIKGDAVIIDIANKIKSFFCLGDCVARLGGDEFLVFIPNETDIESIRIKLRNILRASYTTIGEGDDAILISCSIGVVILQKDIEYNFESLYKLADDALYESKRNGKNTYTIWNNIKY